MPDNLLLRMTNVVVNHCRRTNRKSPQSKQLYAPNGLLRRAGHRDIATHLRRCSRKAWPSTVLLTIVRAWR